MKIINSTLYPKQEVVVTSELKKHHGIPFTEDEAQQHPFDSQVA